MRRQTWDQNKNGKRKEKKGNKTRKQGLWRRKNVVRRGSHSVASVNTTTTTTTGKTESAQEKKTTKKNREKDTSSRRKNRRRLIRWCGRLTSSSSHHRHIYVYIVKESLDLRYTQIKMRSFLFEWLLSHFRHLTQKQRSVIKVSYASISSLMSEYIQFSF
jgi:hypothetical protein